MMQNDSERFARFSFANDSNCSYLKFELDDGADILHHQFEMISQNPSSSFIPFHIRRVDEIVSIYYNITSKIPLAEYLKRKRLSKKEFLDLLGNITKGLMLHSSYLLELPGYVLDKEFIFINPATAEVSLLYIPISRHTDAYEEYKSLLKDLIVNAVSVDDSAKDNYLQRILNYLKSEAFSLADFNRLITELRNSGVEYRARTAGEEAAVSYVPAEKGLVSVADERTACNRRLLNIVLLQVLIVLAAAIACLALLSRSMADIVSLIGIIAIAAAIDILVMSRLGGKQVKHSRKAESEQCMRSARYRPISKGPGMFRDCNTIMMAQASEQDCPYLEGVGIHSGERIIINKDKFVIGRLGSMVDYIIQGSTIGKLHAEITAAKGIYCIRDLNSKNGTYINDVRIPSNKEFELKDRDRIRLSNLEYVFRQQQVL